jgi:prephenate dehydrogenase
MIGFYLRTGVVGAGGRMGGWLLHYLCSLGHEVVPVDVRNGQLGFVEGLDLVVVSVPISVTPTIIHTIAPLMRKGSVLVEIASLKAGSHRALVDAARFGVTPLCIHPMFGPSLDSLTGRVIVVIPVTDIKEEQILAQQLFPGTVTIVIDAEHHDRYMGAVLSLPYAMNLALARVLGGYDLTLLSQMAGSTFALQYILTQSVAGEDSSLIRDLLNENASLESLMHTFNDSLGEVLKASGDQEKFAALHREIVETLSRDPSYSKADQSRRRAHKALMGV